MRIKGQLKEPQPVSAGHGSWVTYEQRSKLARVKVRFGYRILDDRIYCGFDFLFGFEFPNDFKTPFGGLVNQGTYVDEVFQENRKVFQELPHVKLL